MWRYTSYIQRGLSHIRRDTECQDAVNIRENEACIIAALADGLGSLPYSRIAAETAVQEICRFFLGLEKRLQEENTDQLKHDLLLRVQQAVQEKAEKETISISMMDCTICFAYICKKDGWAVSGYLGDGAVLIFTDQGVQRQSDNNISANGTCALMDRNAEANFEIHFWNPAETAVLGFILTSDGLEGELYLKALTNVKQIAADYFNVLVLDENPEKWLKDKIEALTAAGGFEDDISIAVLSRANAPVTLAPDPTWLCSCGARNQLQHTYCCKCGMDFTYLYQHICFED